MSTRTLILSAVCWSAVPGLLISACAQNAAHGADQPLTNSPAARQTTNSATGQRADAFARLTPTRGNRAAGQLRLITESNGVRVTGTITGLAPDSTHGIHIHHNGDCNSPDASSAGGHFAPFSHPHGSPGGRGHVGDLGNVTANHAGIAYVDVLATGATLNPATSTDISGRAIIVHAQADDLITQPAGNSGARIACGIIE
jgi:Cu-Zn family superoxide dismutase